MTISMQAANDNKLATVFHRTVLGFQATLGGRFQFADLSTSPTITWEGTCSALGVAKNNGIQTTGVVEKGPLSLLGRKVIMIRRGDDLEIFPV